MARLLGRQVEAAERDRAAGDYATARDGYARIVARLRRGPSWWHSPLTKLFWAQALADALSVLGEIDMTRGRPDLARVSFEEARLRYQDLVHEASEDFAIVLNNLGVVYERLGLLPESAEALRRAVEISPDPRASLTNLALTLQAAGYPDAAMDALDRAAAFPGPADEVSRVLDGERVFHLMHRGDYATALVRLTERFERAGDPIDAAYAAGNLAQAYAELQELPEALRWQERAVQLRRRWQPGSLPLAIALHNLADTLASHGRAAEADGLLAEAAGLAAAIAPHGPELAAMRATRVWQLHAEGDPAAAVAVGEQALAALPALTRKTIGLLLALGFAETGLGRRDRARAHFDRARDLGTKISPLLPELRWVETALGRHLLDDGATAEAAGCFDRAIAVAESLRPGSAAEPGLERLFGTARSAYHGRIQAAWRERTPAGDAIAFHAAESFRARTLAELLTGPLPAPPPEAAQLVRELDETRWALGTIHRTGTGDPAPLEERAEWLRLRLRALDPRTADREAPRAGTLTEVQRELAEGVTVAVYEVTDDGVFLFAVRRDSFTFHRLDPSTERVVAAVEAVAAACADPESAAPVDELRQLGEWLLRPLADRLGTLAICASGVLALLPFEALELDGATLLEHSVVWSIPSATVLTRFGEVRRRVSGRPFAGFAMAATPGLGALPGAEREVRAAAEIMGDPDAIDLTPTPESVEAEAGDARYVHFAMHGQISDSQPLYSGFPLAGGTFLDAYRIAGFDLVADLVVCSACETAQGESRAGEGVVGLAYALFAAGARGVLVSRWNVLDTVAVRQMRAFYGGLAGGKPPAVAAREAALQIRRRQPHPREWAAFNLIDLSAGRTLR
ncbi:hypothetical protein GCM10010168_45960 [Actinoplanes ianthinogenes]|uniref:CHAT domain-containing protein n=1 Tax=Actinoplanes ianthinogenes TaxID=122358 RepID=A0ABM7LP99_9ACTN|nr:CHAT domain-containing tetratricopeptide repeat protein [Actinoplanes ianthinogenes]BCJ41106.1 hypothetical protein Aiant_17630 [Actinoplanes ianthinogenes]GGR22874.1 hypothetical protein GCM10010168_45960 [Actinoplanes ianthinogenes]